MKEEIKRLKAEIRRIATAATGRPNMALEAVMEVQEQIAERMCKIRALRNGQPQ